MTNEFSIDKLVKHIQLKLEENEVTASPYVIEMILDIQDKYMVENFFINKETK